MFLLPSTTLARILLAFAPGLAMAQTAPATVPAKPAAAGKAAPAKAPPKTLGGATAGGGKLMTRDELRACMKRVEELNVNAKDVDANRLALDTERSELQQQGDSLKLERAEVEKRLAAVREFETRMRAYVAEVEAFNKRNAKAPDAPRGEQEKLAAELEADAARLRAAKPVLEAEGARVLPPYQSAVAGYNERALARDAKVASWNARNVAAQDAAIKHEDARGTWRTDCANRPYSEDDENAIKAGK